MWMVAGIALLCLELFAIDVQFYLIFIGVGAIVVGLIGVIGIDVPTWSQWVLFAALSLVAMFTVRRQLYEKTRGRAVGYEGSGAGDRVTIAEELAPGGSCRTDYRGTAWTAVNVGEEVIPAGAQGVIDGVDGVNLKIRLSK
jgi:membrane protein implicated in regulation of membrane protease activity